MRYFRIGSTCLALLLLAATPAATQTGPRVLSAQEQADQRALRSELNGSKAPHRLDLGNPLHYRLILQILARGGENAQKSPELFRRLEAARAARAEELARTNAAPRAAQPVPTDNPPTAADLNFIATFSGAGGQAYQATGLSSVLYGSTVTSIVMELYDDTSGNVFATNSGSQYSQGTNFQLQVTGTTPEQRNPTTLAQGLFAYVPIDKPQDPPIIVIQQFTDTVNPTDGCMLQPNYCVRNQNNQCISGQYQTTCTNKVTNTTPIKSCWYRGSQAECDYWNNNAHPTNFVFPMSGNVTYPNTVVTPASGVVSIALQNPLRGGGCNVYFQQAQVLTSTYWTVTGQSIAWNFPAAAFPNTGECINYYDGVQLTLWMTAYVALQGTGGPPPFGTINFTSDRSQIGVPGVYVIPYMYVVQGCFAAGTEIMLDDGKTTRPIERFVGDGLEKIATGEGAAMTVGATSVGIEPDKDMVRLATDNGRGLLLTEGHPVILADGTPVLAKYLKVGDRVRTLEGPSALVAVTRERYAGKVYNLLLGFGDDQRDMTLYANGILTGDGRMQNEFARKAAEAERKDPKLARSRLPAEWLVDFDNHQN